MLKYYRLLILSTLLVLVAGSVTAQEKDTDIAIAEACLTQRAEQVPKHRWTWNKYEYEIKVVNNDLSYHVIFMSNDKYPEQVADAVVVTNDQGYCDVPILNASGLTREDYERSLGKDVVQKLMKAYRTRH